MSRHHAETQAELADASPLARPTEAPPVGIGPAVAPAGEERWLNRNVLGTVNGVGDLVASVGVGLLWTVVSPTIAFAY
ncbi:MAG: hypothetical protein HYY04_13025, partial [Chloroflexi bacterium]|nr:hypothetical protein [Chloroflexota bacterium]